MDKRYFTLPIVKVIDEWESEFEKITIVYQIKITSGDHQPDWFPVTCWQKGSTYNIGDRFNIIPNRAQVEAHFKQLLLNSIEIGMIR